MRGSLTQVPCEMARILQYPRGLCVHRCRFTNRMPGMKIKHTRSIHKQGVMPAKCWNYCARIVDVQLSYKSWSCQCLHLVSMPIPCAFFTNENNNLVSSSGRVERMPFFWSCCSPINWMLGIPTRSSTLQYCDFVVGMVPASAEYTPPAPTYRTRSSLMTISDFNLKSHLKCY